MKGFIFTHEVDTVGRRHRDSGPADRPDPRQACPSADWGGSDRTRPYQVWGCTLGTAALSKVRRQIKTANVMTPWHIRCDFCSENSIIEKTHDSECRRKVVLEIMECIERSVVALGEGH